jgi:XTP/dITP diphosphohydrolase
MSVLFRAPRPLRPGIGAAPYTICAMTSPKIPDSLRRVVLASNNPGKLREFSALFAPLGIELVPQGELGVPEAEEPHVTFVEKCLDQGAPRQPPDRSAGAGR